MAEDPCPKCGGSTWVVIERNGITGAEHKAYDPLCNAARASHERLYDVATGRVRAFDDAPEYLPKLFV